MMRVSVVVLLGLLIAASPAAARRPDVNTKIPVRSRIFIEPMDGFETYLTAAFTKKRVPVVIVPRRDYADFTISVTAAAQKSAISVRNLATDVVAFAYSYRTQNSLTAQQNAAESCAKRLKDWIQDGAK